MRTGSGTVGARHGAGGERRAEERSGLALEAWGATLLALIDGPLNGDSSTRLEQSLRRADQASRVVVDLRGASYVDSAGVRTLLQLQDALETEERELRLVVQPGSKVERTLRLLQLQSRFAIDHATDGRARHGAEEWAAA